MYSRRSACHTSIPTVQAPARTPRWLVATMVALIILIQGHTPPLAPFFLRMRLPRARTLLMRTPTPPPLALIAAS